MSKEVNEGNKDIVENGVDRSNVANEDNNTNEEEGSNKGDDGNEAERIN